MASLVISRTISVCVLISFILFSLSDGARNTKLMCYLASWSVYRQSLGGEFRVDKVEPHLCTHIVLAFQGIDEATDKLYSRDAWADFSIHDIGLIRHLMKLKEKNRGLKVLFSVGGWSEGSKKFSDMASDPARRKTFIDSVDNFIKNHHFDGVDMAWEYPTKRGGKAEDRANYVTLLGELKERLGDKLLGLQLMGKPNFILHVYDVERIGQIVDYITLVTYNFNIPEAGVTGHNSPIFSIDRQSVTDSVDLILKNGAPASKVLLGMATYGHPFLMDQKPTSNNYFPVEAKETFAGPSSGEVGFIGYNEVCNFLRTDPGWTEHWDEFSLSSYAVNGLKLLSYDNERSLLAKVSYLKSKGLGGASIWSIDTDDFNGLCNGTSFPLTKSVKYNLKCGVSDFRQNVRQQSPKKPVENTGKLNNGKTLMCYFASWQSYRASSGGNFGVGKIDPELCTHIVYAFQGMNELTNQIQSRDTHLDYDMGGSGQIAQLVALKKQNPNLKILFSVGGWSEGSVKYSKMASDSNMRAAFINSVYEFIMDRGFDGVDMAWEYPQQRGGRRDDKQNFVTLLTELKTKLGSKYLVGLQMYGKDTVLHTSYDIQSISKVVDYMSIVTYNMNVPADLVTGINSPLKDTTNNNIESIVEHVLKNGASPKKVLLGFATYGHPYITNSKVNNMKYFPVPSKDTFKGPWTDEWGFIGFNEVCYLKKTDSSWDEMWHQQTFTPFMVKDKMLISYDNELSFKKKLKYLSSKGLGGAMVWSIDTDDFNGVCYDKNYPLITTIKQHFNKDAIDLNNFIITDLKVKNEILAL